jgi:hypothetical protein|tara:strand:- start:128 stop:1018 length:891 start_codon:yes stop_codon:yes gene_type:complete
MPKVGKKEHHLIPISGKDSLATGIIQTMSYPRDDYVFFFNDTGSELEETYDWLKRVEETQGWVIQRIGQNLQNKIESYQGFIPSHQSRYCTRECKILPMKDFYDKLPGEKFVYYGLRADEDRPGLIPFPGWLPKYPLVEGGIGLELVMQIVRKVNLKPPTFFWKRLHDTVDENLSYMDKEWRRIIDDWVFDLLFSGRTRSNCFHCFYQRQYEWLWLLETKPDLYEISERMETEDFTHSSGMALKELRTNSKLQRKIFDRRAKLVTKGIWSLLDGQKTMKSFDNEIARVSCGLLCGK